MGKKEKQLVGVKEIARRAGVSIATVDRVLHNRSGVSERTKTKIQAIIKDLNYQPNLLARRLASGKTLNLVTLIPEVSEETDYWSVPLEGVLQAEKEIQPYNVKITKLFYDMNNRESFVNQTQIILNDKVDGVLLAPAFIDEAIEFTDICQERKIPFVFINSDIPNQKSLCYFGPNLYHSGYSVAHLVNYLIEKDDKVLLVNISKDIGADHHILRKEEGFKAYLKDHDIKEPIQLSITETDYPSVQKSMSSAFKKHPDIKLVFVTNSRVSKVAKYLASIGREDIILIGYDFLSENIKYLENRTIDFLICEKPQEQAYRGVRALYQKLVFEVDIESEYFMPIDIITKENCQFYKN
ncbi:LacI family DNA-binding transcriptional regulator [Albibacterium profundi]|uniref:LacI family DNA-binding transcriptional regulator n=1 Tax=Albibacterium profundi TaxID=3134906 RepID=A0ABV5CJL4_9SPHI